jgi:hypothetical protein
MGEKGKRETRHPQSKTSMSSPHTRRNWGRDVKSVLSMYFPDPFMIALTFAPHVDFNPFTSRKYNIVA